MYDVGLTVAQKEEWVVSYQIDGKFGDQIPIYAND